VQRVDAGSAGSVGRRAVLACVGALLAGGAVDEEATSASARKGDVVKDGSGDAGGALQGVEGVADGAVEG